MHSVEICGSEAVHEIGERLLEVREMRRPGLIDGLHLGSCHGMSAKPDYLKLVISCTSINKSIGRNSSLIKVILL